MPNALARVPLNRWLSPHRRAPLYFSKALCGAAIFILAVAAGPRAHALTAQQQRAFEIYKELIEINTVTQTGDTGRAADAMAARLIAAAF